MSENPEADKTLNAGDAGSVGFGVVPDGETDPNIIAKAAFATNDTVKLIRTGEPARVDSVVKTQTGHYVYRVKLIDQYNEVKGVAVCGQEDLERRGIRSIKRGDEAVDVVDELNTVETSATQADEETPDLAEKAVKLSANDLIIAFANVAVRRLKRFQAAVPQMDVEEYLSQADAVSGFFDVWKRGNQAMMDKGHHYESFNEPFIHLRDVFNMYGFQFWKDADRMARRGNMRGVQKAIGVYITRWRKIAQMFKIRKKKMEARGMRSAEPVKAMPQIDLGKLKKVARRAVQRLGIEGAIIIVSPMGRSPVAVLTLRFKSPEYRRQAESKFGQLRKSLFPFHAGISGKVNPSDYRITVVDEAERQRWLRLRGKRSAESVKKLDTIHLLKRDLQGLVSDATWTDRQFKRSFGDDYGRGDPHNMDPQFVPNARVAYKRYRKKVNNLRDSYPGIDKLPSFKKLYAAIYLPGSDLKRTIELVLKHALPVYREAIQQRVVTKSAQPVKKLRDPDQLALVLSVHTPALQTYRKWIKGNIKADDLTRALRQAKIVASRFAKEFPRGEKHEMPRIVKGLARAYRKAVQFQAGNTAARKTAVHWLYQELALLSEMLGASPPPFPKLAKRSKAVKGMFVKADDERKFIYILSEAYRKTLAHILTPSQRQWHMENPIYNKGKNLPKIYTAADAERDLKEIIFRESGGRYGSNRPLSMGSYKRDVVDIGKTAAHSAGINMLFGKKPRGTVSASQLTAIARKLFNSHQERTRK